VITLHELAEQACEIEITKLGEPVGKQDPYIAAFGGIRCFQFERDGGVKTERLRISADTLCDLEENLLLFFTGYSRSAGGVLKEQDERSRQNEEGVLGYLHHVKELGLCSKRLLEEGDVQGFGELMNDHWESKRRFNERMTNADIDRWHDIAMKNGAVGGKLVGAGSGGFLMFYAVDRARLRQALRREGLEEVRFQFDFEGTKILVA